MAKKTKISLQEDIIATAAAMAGPDAVAIWAVAALIASAMMQTLK